MEYTPEEKNVLAMMHRTDFKNMSKSDVISFASKLGELRPEVAKDILAQYPEFVSLMKSTILEYRSLLDSIIKSDDESLSAYYSISNKELDNASESRQQFYDIVKQVQADYSKLLDNPDLSPEMTLEILNRENDLVKMSSEKDTEIRKQESTVEDKAYKKDSEKRDFDWKALGAVSFALTAIIGLSAGVLGGRLDIKLPKK